MSTQLPFELLALIMDFVSADAFSHDKKVHDTTTLRQCALVSPQLVAHCQKHIFSQIQISYDKPEAISSLQQVLDIDHPEIASYIKVLSITLRPAEHNLAQPSIDRILDKCTEVVNLTVVCSLEYRSGMKWERHIPQSTRAALESVIYSPKCTTLDFDNIQIPFSVFFTPRRCVPAQSLSFSRRGHPNGTLEAPLGKIQDQRPSYSSLRFLSLVPTLIPSFLSPMFHDGRYLFDLSNLGTLWVDHSYSTVEPNVTVQLLRRTTRLRTLGFKLQCMCCINSTVHRRSTHC